MEASDPAGLKLSILMPAYNESSTLASSIKRVLEVDYPCDVELVVVDDGSTDESDQILAGFDDARLVTTKHPTNRGKGAAITTAARCATGDYAVICDADLEYSPAELPEMIAPVLEGEATVVFGTRTFGSHTAYSFWYVVGNWLVTMFANVLYNAWLSDIETCFKLMPIELYRSLGLREEGFGVEAEITGKLLKRGIRPFEVHISYRARTREEGKKLTWRDGVEALWILTRVRFLSKS